MGTLANPGPNPPPAPSAAAVAAFYSTLKQMFPGQTAQAGNPQSEAEEIAAQTHDALEVIIQVLTLQVTSAAAIAKPRFDVLFAAVQPIWAADGSVPAPVFTQFVAAVNAKEAAFTANQKLAGFVTQVNEWWANASQGTANVPAVPVVPPDLTAAVNAAVTASKALGS